MVQITINIPDDKVQILLDAIEKHTEQDRALTGEEFSPQYALSWAKQYLIGRLRAIVIQQQREEALEAFEPDDLNLS